MVTKPVNREIYTGKRFMKFTLEDFNGNYEFVLFGKDCEKFSSQIIMNEKICIQGRVEKKWRDSTDYRVRIHEIEPLSILKKRIKTCNIRINILDLNDTLISQIDDLISQIDTAVNKKDKEEEQKFPVKFQIYDRYEEIYITMNPQGERGSISHELFEELQNIDKIDFSLN